MIFEWRVYEVVPGKRQALNERFAKHALRLFAKHGIKAVGFWESRVGGPTNTLYYMLEFRDLAHLDEAWQSFRSDPEWHAVVEESERGGPLVARITSMVLSPTQYSPMQ